MFIRQTLYPTGAGPRPHHTHDHPAFEPSVYLWPDDHCLLVAMRFLSERSESPTQDLQIGKIGTPHWYIRGEQLRITFENKGAYKGEGCHRFEIVRTGEPSDNAARAVSLWRQYKAIPVNSRGFLEKDFTDYYQKGDAAAEVEAWFGLAFPRVSRDVLTFPATHEQAIKEFWAADPNIPYFRALALERYPQAKSIEVKPRILSTTQIEYPTYADGVDVFGGGPAGKFIASPPDHREDTPITRGIWHTDPMSMNSVEVWPTDKREGSKG